MGLCICDECIDNQFPKVNKKDGSIWGDKCSNPECKHTSKKIRLYYGLSFKCFKKSYDDYYKMKPTNKNLAAFFAVSEKTIHNYKNGCEGKQILYEAMKEKFLKVQQNAGLKKVKFIRKFDSSFCPLKTYKVLKVCNGGKFYIVADSDGNEMDNLMHVEDCEEIKC